MPAVIGIMVVDQVISIQVIFKEDQVIQEILKEVQIDQIVGGGCGCGRGEEIGIEE